MRKILFVLLFVSILKPFCWAQEDTTKINWDRVLYEVFTTKQDSVSSDTYLAYKKPFFEAYFNSFPPDELDSLVEKCLILRMDIVSDSLKYPEYMTRLNYYWNVPHMRWYIRYMNGESNIVPHMRGHIRYIEEKENSE